MSRHTDGSICPWPIEMCDECTGKTNCRPACSYVYNVVGDQTYKCHREVVEGSTRCVHHHMIAFPPIPYTMTVNGATISAEALISIFNQITNPISGRWYSYERQGENVIVHTKQE